MREDGRIIDTEDGETLVQDADGEWHNKKNCDMGHLEDAVDYWNEEGHQYGKKNKKVRNFMLNPENYEFEPSSKNRSKGGKKRARYRDPIENPDEDASNE